MPLRIPDTDKERLAKFLKLEPVVLDKLYVALEACSPKLDPNDLITDVSERAQLDHSVVGDVVPLLLRLYRVHVDLGLEPEELADEIASAVEATADSTLTRPDAGWDSFKRNLVRFLSLEHSLGVTSKALFVASQFPRHFHTARILTDARPVFTTNPTDPPAAFVIFHTLQIEFGEEGIEDREWFIALNLRDLEVLKEVVDRAIAKEKSVRDLLKKTEVPTLTWEE